MIKYCSGIPRIQRGSRTTETMYHRLLVLTKKLMRLSLMDLTLQQCFQEIVGNNDLLFCEIQ